MYRVTDHNVEVVMDELDRILADGAPWTSADEPEVRRSIAEMSDAAATAAGTRKRGTSPRSRRVATAVLAASLGLAGVGVAAASSLGWWGGQGSPELVLDDVGLSDDCLAGFRVTGQPEDSVDVVAARAALRSMSAADLDLAATELAMASNGRLREEDTADERWHTVVHTAVHQEIAAELVEQGIDPVGEWGLLGHSECSGDTE